MDNELAQQLSHAAEQADADLVSMAVSLAMARALPATSGLRKMSEMVFNEACEHADAFSRAHRAIEAGDFEGAIRALEQPVLH